MQNNWRYHYVKKKPINFIKKNKTVLHDKNLQETKAKNEIDRLLNPFHSFLQFSSCSNGTRTLSACMVSFLARGIRESAKSLHRQ